DNVVRVNARDGKSQFGSASYLDTENTCRSTSGRKTLMKSLQGSPAGSTTAPAVSRTTYSLHKAGAFANSQRGSSGADHPFEAFQPQKIRSTDGLVPPRVATAVRNSGSWPFELAERLKPVGEFKVYPAPG